MRRHFGVPEEVAGARIDRNEMGIKGRHKKRFSEDGHAAIISPTADSEIVRHFMIITPVLASRASVDSDDIRGGFGDKHNAVNDQGNCFRPVNNRNLVCPLHFQLANVVGVNAVEQAVALTIQCAGVHQPVIGLIAGVYQSLPGYRRKGGSDYRRELIFLCARGGSHEYAYKQGCCMFHWGSTSRRSENK